MVAPKVAHRHGEGLEREPNSPTVIVREAITAGGLCAATSPFHPRRDLGTQSDRDGKIPLVVLGQSAPPRDSKANSLALLSTSLELDLCAQAGEVAVDHGDRQLPAGVSGPASVLLPSLIPRLGPTRTP